MMLFKITNTQDFYLWIFEKLSTPYLTVYCFKNYVNYGIRGPAHSLLKSYQASRTQFASLNSASSTPKPINIGVPQGSILGPLFLIYINDLPNSTNIKPRLFADDTCLVRECN